MSTNFPTSLDNTDSQKVTDGSSVIVAALPNNLLDMVEALEGKVGADSSSVQSSIDFFMRKNYVKLSDVKAAGVDGGTFTAGAWRTRTLNTEDHDAGGLCSLSSNQITLTAGTYRCFIRVPALQVDHHQARLYDVTGSTVLVMGSTAFSDNASGYAVTDSIIAGQFTIAASHALEVQHYAAVSRSTYGFGEGWATAMSSIFTVAEFWKLY